MPLGTGGAARKVYGIRVLEVSPGEEETVPMRVAMSERIVAVVLFVGAALVLSAAATEA
jgi:hypothetical protein